MGRRAPSARNRIAETIRNEATPAIVAWSLAAVKSSVSSAGSPVMRTRAPVVSSMRSSRTISRSRSMAAAKGRNSP